MTDDTQKAREYSQTPFGIEPVRYGAYLDGRQSLRREVTALTDALRAAREALKQVAFYAKINHGTLCKDYGEVVAGPLALLEGHLPKEDKP